MLLVDLASRHMPLNWFARALSGRWRIAIVGIVLAVVVVAHWLTPTGAAYLHAVHLTLRKLLFLPVILGAVWFGLRGSMVTAALATALYVPHVLYQWSGQVSENLNQLGELGSVWIVALLAGVLVGRERRAQQRALAIHQGALTALVTALDAREPMTERHSLRVASFVEQLGREMGLGGSELNDLRIAALLHDIGKVGVPDGVLTSQTALSEEDRALVQRHPEIGFRILRAVPSLSGVAEVVYSHHERFDGSGYPRGLIAEEIPLHARILSVVDVFDALTTDRTYRENLGPVSARRWIGSQRDSQFDGDVVEAFLRVPSETWWELARHSGDSTAEVGALIREGQGGR